MTVYGYSTMHLMVGSTLTSGRVLRLKGGRGKCYAEGALCCVSYLLFNWYQIAMVVGNR